MIFTVVVSDSDLGSNADVRFRISTPVSILNISLLSSIAIPGFKLICVDSFDIKLILLIFLIG